MPAQPCPATYFKAGLVLQVLVSFTAARGSGTICMAIFACTLQVSADGAVYAFLSALEIL